MENKAAENTDSQLTTEPVLVNVIIETLSKEVEQIKELLSKDSFVE
ncbi:hypothetical protein OQY15_11870 [Pedobacter sp. MC2016-15]|jgi:hypothetical protein|nr:hypothetical protein [Pedobacter sp. MC2016-15]MCX2479786.1 hypothetical protein [Pedobacter sp. MC2016-15]